MEPAQIIREIGGGLAAVVIVAEAIAIVILYKRNVALVNKLLDLTIKMGGEIRELADQSTRALGTYGETLREAVREMRGRK